MAKTIIKGRFATAADAAAVHEIPEARRQELDRVIEDVIQTMTVKLASKRRKREGSSRSGKTVGLRAKRK